MLIMPILNIQWFVCNKDFFVVLDELLCFLQNSLI